MELKPSITAFFLVILLLALPCSSRGIKRISDRNTGIYDIDYRGPETHSYIPPPNRSRGKHNNIHQSKFVPNTKSEALRGQINGGRKKIHG